MNSSEWSAAGVKGSVLVTGASGFIGRTIAMRFARLGWRVFGTVGRSGMAPPNPIKALDAFSMNALDFKKLGVSTCLHLAEAPVFGPEQSLRNQRRNLEWLISQKFPNTIYFSSGKVYGHRAHHDFTEDDEVNPEDAYATFKLEAEAFLASSGGVTILRLSNVYGAIPRSLQGVRPKSLVQQIASQVDSGSRVIALRSRGAVRDFIHVTEVADATVAVVRSAYRGVLNVSTGEGLATEEVAQRVVGLANDPGISIRWDTEVRDDSRLVLANDKIWALTGWRPTMRVPDGLAAKAPKD